ncbi:helix-turn-helix transcriptional regulator, partial [Streptomyces durbertensis]
MAAMLKVRKDLQHGITADDVTVTGVSALAEVGDSARGPTVPNTPRTDPLGFPLLHTRITPRVIPPTHLRRPRLLRRLDDALDAPLTVVNGPAGAGKSLLAADWVAGLGQPVAWLNAEAEDRRPGVFWTYLLHALDGCGSPTGDAVGAPAEAAGVDRRLLAALAAELEARTEPLVVVIDEFERVTGPEVPEQLEFVLHHAGRGLRLVLLSRVEPLLPLHRYRAAGELVEIRAEDLAFEPAEAAALLGLHGLSLPAAVCRGLVERTRGWAAGLRLCAVAAVGAPDPAVYLKEFEANQSPVADFLSAEVLARQPADVQDALLRLSVLDRFCPDQANALTARRDAEGLLLGLRRENAFVEHLGQEWYRFHPLFGEILRAHLRLRLPGLEPELHRRAARWLRRSGDLRAALAHGAAAGEWDFAAQTLVDELAIGRLLTGLRATDLSELFSGMEPGATSPAADLVRAALDLARCDVRHGRPPLRRAGTRLAEAEREAAARDGASGSSVPEAAARLSCALLEVLSARLTGSPDRAEEAAEAADELLQELPRPLLDDHPELPALLLTHLGSARLWAGRFEEADRALSAAAKGPDGASTVLPREDSVGHLALMDLLDGWPGRAERRVLAGVSEAERFSLPEGSRPPVGRLVLAAVALERHDLGRARELLDETALSGSCNGDPVAAAEQALVTARLLLGRGRARDAAEAIETADVAGWSSATATASPWATGHRLLVTAAGRLAEGRPEEAVRVLGEVSPEGSVTAEAAGGLVVAEAAGLLAV